MWKNKPLSAKGVMFCKTHKVLLTESLEVQVMGENKGRFKVYERNSCKAQSY